MQIIQYKKYPKDELISRLRRVKLLNTSKTKNQVFVYKNSDIELTNIPVSSILPSQFYYLEESLLKVGNIQEALFAHNLDLFKLDGFINYHTNESDIIYNLLPIVIEYQLEKDGIINPIIVDGLHRILLARNQNIKDLQVIKIANVSRGYPYPGYINPNGWEDVKPMKTAPSKENKRLWRFPIEEAYKYYRDFNSAFYNVGKPRIS